MEFDGQDRHLNTGLTARHRSSRLLGLLLALLLGLSGCKSGSGKKASTAAPGPDEGAAVAKQAGDLGTILKAYRQTIVLMWDERNLSKAERPRAFVVGKYLFEGNREKLSVLADQLDRDLDRAAESGFKNSPLLAEAFLQTLENDPSWHDADKLVFRDTVASLTERLRGLGPSSPAGKAMLTRLTEDARVLDAIRSVYDKEMDKVFAQFQTRGMPVRREAWEVYLAYLRTLYTAKEIMQEHWDTVAPSVTVAPPKPEKILTGSSLPEKTFVLTFDDGPHSKWTPEILDLLARFKVKGVFFELGENLGREDGSGAVTESRAAGESKKVLQGGNLVGNHTYDHAFLPKLTDERVQQEMDLTNRIIKSVDSATPTLFRPPYGALSETVRADAEARGMKVMLWNIDSLDWADPIPKSVANRVIGEAKEKGRGVMLFHDIHEVAAEALPLVLETLQGEGYRFVLWDGTAVIDRGGSRAEPAPPPSPLPQLYRESWAVVIGINGYQKWPKLNYAVGDALAFRDLLVNKFGFKPENVTTLLDGDATRERIVSILGDSLANGQKVQREDRVIVFFAGHGTTRTLPSGRSLGYIVPVDADTENFQGQCISMTNFQDIDEAVPAKHVFYIMDACYSGLALMRGGETAAVDPRKYLQEVTKRTARQMLTAGEGDQPVSDSGPGGHSIFTWTILQGLDGRADLNGDGFITASELFAYTGPIVSSLSKQTPAFGSLAGSEGGEVVFELKHESEDLGELSQQLADEGIRLNAQLDAVQRSIAEQRERNKNLEKELVAAKRELARMGAGLVEETPAEKAKRNTDKGLALYREKKYPEALASFEDAFATQPSNAQVANNIGFVYYRMEKYEEALAWYQKSLALDPGRAIAWANTGEADEKLGRRDDALKAYRHFLEMAPTHPSAAYVQARVAALGQGG